ncbi:lipoprotein [Gordonia phage Nibbles]|nr:lipoprotein [Gordonia phage Nibbles]
MRKFILALAMVFVVAGCSAEAPRPRLVNDPATTPTPHMSVTPTTISDDPDEEVMIQGYIKVARRFLDQGAIERDAVTVDLIRSELPYVDDDQAEAIRKEILK